MWLKLLYFLVKKSGIQPFTLNMRAKFILLAKGIAQFTNRVDVLCKFELIKNKFKAMVVYCWCYSISHDQEFDSCFNYRRLSFFIQREVREFILLIVFKSLLKIKKVPWFIRFKDPICQQNLEFVEVIQFGWNSSSRTKVWIRFKKVAFWSNIVQMLF